jgi:uncharacterized protein YjbI with pentapeptide repeats
LDLTRANLTGTNLSEADLQRTNFFGAIVHSTIFGGVDLSSCIGLDSVMHGGPSSLGVDSIILSKGANP